MKLFKIENLEFIYDKAKVLKNISLDLDKGIFYSIIGPNGSGKSTLLKNLANIYRPAKGKIYFKDKNINSIKKRELAKSIALVAQDTNIDYAFTVEEVVLMGRYPYKKRLESETAKDLSIARQAMERTQTLHLKDRLINELSAGERQRAIIARALAQETDTILLDEPTSNLDINHQVEILNLLKELNQEGTTVVLVIHDINLAARYSDQIILLKEGQIESQGQVDQVINRENIENVYKLKVAIDQNPHSHSPHVTPLN